MGWRVSVYGVILSWLLLATAQAQELPIFDAHIHYSRPDWQVFPPERILAIFDQAGVQRALVSSTPDDGTLQLYAIAPQRIVPFLRSRWPGWPPAWCAAAAGPGWWPPEHARHGYAGAAGGARCGETPARGVT